MSVERGGSPRPIKAYITESEDGVNWIKIGDSRIGSKYICSTKEKIKPEGVKRSRTVNVGDLLLSNSMSFGRAYILKTNGCIHDGWLVLHPYLANLNREYLYYLFASTTLANQFKKLAKGSTVSNLNEARVSTVLIPLPPILEQKAIVSAIEQRFRLLDAILEALVRYRRILSETPTSLRQQLIQAAIQGQLVPQNPDDEPASVLLKRIAEERVAKLGKKAAKSMSRIVRRGSKTYELFPDGSEKDISDEIPFEIPRSWEWSRLGTITIKLTDGSHNPPPKKTEGYRVISAQNIRHGKIEFFEHDRFTDQLGFEKENLRTDIKFGDVILGIIGGSIGNTAIYDKEDKVVAQRSIAIIRAGIPSQFLLVLLRSPLFQHCFQQASSGSAQGGIYLGALSQLLVPLPPESEQLRIVKKLDKVLSLLAL